MKSIPIVRATFLLMAAVIAVSLAATYWIGLETISSQGEVSSRQVSLRELQQALVTLLDAETGQRGYLLTGREEYLAPYNDALGDLPRRISRLRNAARNGEFPEELAERFEELSGSKVAELRETVAVAQQRGSPAAAEIVLTDEGRKLMDGLRITYAAIVRREEQQLEIAESRSRFLIGLRTGVFAAAGLINLGFLAWAYRRIRREVGRRYVADLEAGRQKEILAVSLASIGDAVILADLETRIIFMNDVAEQLTGWKRDEAVGRPCATIFRIVNETTRAAVESPVDLVLRTGKVVGLANHTLLIRKDGVEVPIDDSGAPVREPDGVVRGVVLVFRDFSKYKNAEREMREIKDRLEQANRAKDDFLAALSHELRTPLTPVLGMLSSWESDDTLPAPVAEDVRMLSRNVRLEVRLIDDLLDLTRISRGEMSLHKESVDAHALLAAVVEIFRRDLDVRQIRIGVRAAAERHCVEADPARLQQVFWNILGNAVKFTPSGGRIEILTANEGDELRVTFADNGRGMTAETLRHIFRPFERAASQTGYQPAGLGIGLTISQCLVQAHGGRIEAQSAGADLGSTFIVRLPALADQPGRGRGSRSASDNSGAPGRSLSVLLVEDHADSAAVIARIVRSMGHTAIVSHNVAEGLDVIGKEKLDLVLSDIGLPDGTGIELLRKARAFSQVPMIALTGYGMEDDLVKYREAGFLHQLTKPIRFQELSQVLREFSEGALHSASGLTVHAPRADQ